MPTRAGGNCKVGPLISIYHELQQIANEKSLDFTCISLDFGIFPHNLCRSTQVEQLVEIGPLQTAFVDRVMLRK